MLVGVDDGVDDGVDEGVLEFSFCAPDEAARVAYTPPKPAAWQPLAPKGAREVDSVKEMPGFAQGAGRAPALEGFPENHARLTIVEPPAPAHART